MPLPRALLSCLFVVLVSVIAAHAQTAPLCDVECAPNPSSPSYGGTFAARSLSHNARGQGAVFSARAGGGPRTAPTIAGSQSSFYAIPILHLPGRNGLDLDLTLYYSSRVWTIDKVNNTATFNADRDFPSYGFRIGFGFLEGPTGGKYIWTAPDGSKHQLNSAGDSEDSTYVHYDSANRILILKDGTRWKFEPTSTSTIFRPIEVKDTNGNYITIHYTPAGSGVSDLAIDWIIDTLGRTMNFIYTTNKLTSITAPAFGGSGNTTIATFTWGTATLKYSFSSPLTVKDTQANNSTINVLTGCRYASNVGYNFIYGDWGLVKQIDQVSANASLRSRLTWNFPLGTTAQSDAPAFSQQTVFDGVNTGTWTYTVTKTNSLVSSVLVTDPAGTKTTTNLDTGVFAPWAVGLLSSVAVANSAGTVLRTTTTTWTQDGSSSPPINPRIQTVSLKLNDSGQTSQVSYAFTAYGNVSQVVEYDYGPRLVRITQTDYSTDPNLLSKHILDRPVQVRVYDPTNNNALVSRTDFAYDETPPSSLTGVTQHDDTNYGAAFNFRGNLTSTTRYPSLPATTPSIRRTFSYDSLGNLTAAQVDCCQQESWTFGPATQYAYPETTTRGGGGATLSTSRLYDFNTALVSSVQDENQKLTSFGYDTNTRRLLTITRPDTSQVSFTYDDLAAQPSVSTTTPIDATKSVKQATTVDGLGRTTKQETKDAASTVYSVVDTQYDTLGRVAQVSNPHGPSETAIWTQNQYDALNRVTKVIPPDGSPTANNTQFAYSGNNTTVTDPAGKQRRTYTNALGRLSQVHEPGYDDGLYGTGSVTISGALQCKLVPNDNPPPNNTCLWDSGGVSITVGSFTATYGYGCDPATVCDDKYSIASSLASIFNNDANSPVTATPNLGVLTLTARFPGPQGNYPLSATVGWDTTNFTNPSFTATLSGPTLTGGVDGSGANGHAPSLATPLVTVYSYGALDNLTKVFQGQQQRLYSYDSMGRLLSATTPESGTVSYTYNDFSDVSMRTDARTVKTLYQYDTLNRLVGVHYDLSQAAPGVAAMPDVCTSAIGQPANVCFSYGTSSASNNNGRLVGMTDPSGSESYTSYDVMGRLTAMSKSIAGTSYPLAYQYNFAGELTQVTYPSGRAVAQTFDAIGRLNQLQVNGANYLSGISYNAAYEPLNLTYGNGITGAFTYNTRLQLSMLAYTKPGQTLFSLAYGYGTGNNGQIQSITDNVDSGRTANYSYDAWARLKTAASTGSTQYPAWGLSWSYDRYGNRKQQTVTAGSGVPSNSVTPSPTTNRLTDPGYAYDLSGNMTNDGLNTMTYNGESRVATSSQAGTTTTYTYDGNGLRVKKQVGSATPTVYIFSGTKVIAEYASGTAPGSPTREYVYSGAQLLATIESGATKYYISDHLSLRVTTDSSGVKVADSGHYPFGENWYETGGVNKLKFTSYERDSESGNDYAMIRTSVTRLGRFSSPDPLAGSITDPQSLNRFAYTRNDPINLIDPLGLLGRYWIDASQSGNFIALLLGGSEFADVGIYLGSFCSPVYDFVWNGEGFTPVFVGTSCSPTQGRRSGGEAAAFLALKTGANTLTNPENLNKEECQKDLAKLGITTQQVRAGAATANFINGVGGNVPLSSLYATSPHAGVRQAGRSATGTVGDKLAQPGTVAVSQLGGPDIYINPAMIDPRNYLGNLGTAFHEIVHNVSGLTDPDIQRALGIKEQPVTHNITEKLLKDCF